MKHLLPTIAVCLAFAACTKNNSNTNEPTKTDLITSGPWKYEDAGADADRNGTIDLSITSSIPACVLDNTLNLSADGTGTVDEGASKCNAADPQTNAVTWSFANNESALNIGGSGVIGISGQFKILTLTATSLTLSKDTTFQGLSTAMVVKLKH